MGLQKSSTRLSSLQNYLLIKEFDAILRNQTCRKCTQFLIIQGENNSPLLISKDTMIGLGMLQIKEDGSFANQNDMCIPDAVSEICAETTNKLHKTKEGITSKFGCDFERIWHIKDMKKYKEI